MHAAAENGWSALVSQVDTGHGRWPASDAIGAMPAPGELDFGRSFALTLTPDGAGGVAGAPELYVFERETAQADQTKVVGAALGVV